MTEKKRFFWGLCIYCLLFVAPVENAASSGMKPSNFSIEKSLPQSRLSYYCDSFNKLRNDIWEESELTYYGPQFTHMPDISIEDGRLRIETKTGGFSKGGLRSRYSLRGDFDIQVGCHMDFLEKTPDMDQALLFVVKGRYKEVYTFIGLSKRADRNSRIFTFYREKGKPMSPFKWQGVGNFHGTMRVVRIGNKISTLFQKEGESEWEKLGTFKGMTGEVVIGFGVNNFHTKRATIKAESSVTARFDNFKINAAQEIIEEKVVPTTALTGCDKAQSIFWEGKYSPKKEAAFKYYMEAINLCPGFIRPYELVGNYYRKEGQTEKALEFLTKAAELGTTNYKLYYLLASLLFEKGDLNEASRHLKKSLSIRGDYPKALVLKDKVEKALDKDGPKIILFEPATRRGLKTVHQFENITVRGIATDKSEISWVKVNQMDVSLDENGNFLKDIPIKIGKNIIIVEAADGLGNRSDISVTVEGQEYILPAISKIDSSLQEGKLYGKSYALVIGINNYERWPALEFAVNDAKAVKQKLEETGFNEIITIFDKEATQRRILTELFHNLPQKVGHNDRVLFYFAGHGQTEDLANGGKRGYIIPFDGDTSSFSDTAISMEQIRSLSSRISAKHILYVMDSCYSGLGLNRSSGVSPKIGDYLRKVSSMRVVQVITAGGKGEQVQEKAGHGLFTTYFLKALEGEADFNKDNVVTGTELGAYLRPVVSNASNQAQTPLYGRLEGEGEFLLFVTRE